MDNRLTEINNFMSTLMGRVNDMDTHVEELESIGDFNELHEEIQVVVNSVLAGVNKEIQAL